MASDTLDEISSDVRHPPMRKDNVLTFFRHHEFSAARIQASGVLAPTSRSYSPCLPGVTAPSAYQCAQCVRVRTSAPIAYQCAHCVPAFVIMTAVTKSPANAPHGYTASVHGASVYKSRYKGVRACGRHDIRRIMAGNASQSCGTGTACHPSDECFALTRRAFV
ncbi:hypothetical protein Bbelb_211680 [Branchiostoma belcheri]|nr:hypothetical protein Bbelb_211680 [Branchiostoma belcheri]